MFPQPDDVMAELGDNTIESFVLAVRQLRDDYADLRSRLPSWPSKLSSRGLANLLHDLLWANIVEQFAATPGITLVDREPLREVGVSTNYVLRVKRHNVQGQIASYPTQAAIGFYRQGDQAMDGLESVCLAVGYQWDCDDRTLGPAVISLPNGMRNPHWIVDLDARALSRDSTGTGVEQLLPVSESPQVPTITVVSAVNEDQEANESW